MHTMHKTPNIAENLKQPTLKSGEGGGWGSGKGWNCTYGGYWYLEELFFFFDGSVSPILQLVVAKLSSFHVPRLRNERPLEVKEIRLSSAGTRP